MKKRLIAFIATVAIALGGFAGVANAAGITQPAKPSATSADFKDVRKGDIFYKEIKWMKTSGYSTGWSDNTYRPLQDVKRDAVMAFLYRMAGSPEVNNPHAHPFSDIDPSMPHYIPIVWAAQNGISTGWFMKDGTQEFRPYEPIKRDAMAAFLYRINGPEPIYSHYSFRDVNSRHIFEWEMRWMNQKGISTGWSDGTYRPFSNTKRDAMAAFLYRAERAGVFDNM